MALRLEQIGICEYLITTLRETTTFEDKALEKDLLNVEQDLLTVAFLACLEMVEDYVQQLCHRRLVPALDEKGSRLVPDPLNVRGIWEFDSLLGAMYLQVFLVDRGWRRAIPL